MKLFPSDFHKPNLYTAFQLPLHTHAFDVLSRFTNLTELELTNISVNLAKLHPANLTVMRNVRCLTLSHLMLFDHTPHRGNFCRVFSTVFPELEYLYVDFEKNFPSILDLKPKFCGFNSSVIRHSILPHLYMFFNLRSHEINTDFEPFE